MNETARERFYGPGGDEWGDNGEEYELEPPDAEVLAAEKRRAQEELTAASLAIDVDEIYRGLDHRADLGTEHRSGDGFRFQFQIKHMLILTAAVAVLLSLAQLRVVGPVLALGALIVAGGAVAALDFHQQRKWAEAQRRFEEKYERRRRFLESRLQPQPRAPGEASTIYDDLRFGQGDAAAEIARRPPAKAFRIQFSLQQLMIAMTCAALLIGLVRILGGPANTAALLGVLALGGLVVAALGVNLPQIVVLGWWMVLALYVVFSLIVVLSMLGLAAGS